MHRPLNIQPIGKRLILEFMQKYQRQRHRVVWLFLGPVAAAALVYALLHRVEMPVMDELPVSPVASETEVSE